MRFLLSVLVIALTACGSGKSDQTARDTLTERQKDSILANSKIPNARAVGKAMRVADSTSARMGQADSVARDTSDR